MLKKTIDVIFLLIYFLFIEEILFNKMMSRSMRTDQIGRIPKFRANVIFKVTVGKQYFRSFIVQNAKRGRYVFKRTIMNFFLLCQLYLLSINEICQQKENYELQSSYLKILIFHISLVKDLQYLRKQKIYYLK